MTWHRAFWPQVPMQGSTHFWFIHALFDGHSALTTHSGRQPGGDPIYCGRHEQMACSLLTLHWLLGPQGLGVHGLTGTGAAEEMERINYGLANCFDSYNKIMKGENDIFYKVIISYI